MMNGSEMPRSPRWDRHRTLAVLAALWLGLAAPAAAAARVGGDPGVCDQVQVPTGSQLAFHTYARGVQIYHWNGAAWVFDGPAAVLYADAQGQGQVGIHYSGPTWQTVSDGKVVGTLLQKCTPNPDAIAWLLLGAASDGPGVFQGVNLIQRLNTTGGNPPAAPGTSVGEVARVPYTAEYFFYRAPN